MRIHSLTMKDFRGFEDATVDLDRPLTVLFGVNGSGKSSVIMACVFLLSEILYHALPRKEDDTLAGWAEDTDIRFGARGLSLMATLSNGHTTQPVVVDHRRGAAGYDPSHIAAYSDLHGAAPALSVFYDASRNVTTSVEAFSPSENGSSEPTLRPTSATQDSLVAGELKFRSLFQWFKAREDIENELKVSQQNLSLEDSQLSAVRRAVSGMLPGFSGLRVQRDPLHLVIRKGDTSLAIDQLSDGEKLLLALAADLARRLAMTYTDGSDPLQGEAVVLIDEIELHLHPSWQRRVLASLRSTFPRCQFIVTTHSPQVLSEVPNEAVILVDNFQFVRPGAPTAGRDSNAILEEVMGTPERPAAQLEAIHEISTLLDEGRQEEARVKLEALARELSEQDREVVGLRTMLHFLEGEDEAHPQGG